MVQLILRGMYNYCIKCKASDFLCSYDHLIVTDHFTLRTASKCFANFYDHSLGKTDINVLLYVLASDFFCFLFQFAIEGLLHPPHTPDSDVPVCGLCYKSFCA